MTQRTLPNVRRRVEAIVSDRDDPDLWRLAVAIAGMIQDEAKTRVTLVDLDPSCALSQHVFDPFHAASMPNNNVASVVSGRSDTLEPTNLWHRVTPNDDLYVVPGSRDLDVAFEVAAERTTRSAGRWSAAAALRAWLDTLDTDVVLLTASGARSPWVRAALSAADAWAFTTRADRWAAVDLQRLRTTLRDIYGEGARASSAATLAWMVPPVGGSPDAALTDAIGQQLAVAVARAAWPAIHAAPRPPAHAWATARRDPPLRDCARAVYDPITGVRAAAAAPTVKSM